MESLSNIICSSENNNGKGEKKGDYTVSSSNHVREIILNNIKETCADKYKDYFLKYGIFPCIQQMFSLPILIDSFRNTIGKYVSFFAILKEFLEETNITLDNETKIKITVQLAKGLPTLFNEVRLMYGDSKDFKERCFDVAPDFLKPLFEDTEAAEKI